MTQRQRAVSVRTWGRAAPGLECPWHLSLVEHAEEEQREQGDDQGAGRLRWEARPLSLVRAQRGSRGGPDGPWWGQAAPTFFFANLELTKCKLKQKFGEI